MRPVPVIMTVVMAVNMTSVVAVVFVVPHLLVGLRRLAQPEYQDCSTFDGQWQRSESRLLFAAQQPDRRHKKKRFPERNRFSKPTLARGSWPPESPAKSYLKVFSICTVAGLLLKGYVCLQ